MIWLKGGGFMDWLTKMNAAIDYIESNLADDIDFAVVAMKACCSSYNFQRMFSFITDTTLAEYVRHRRLTQAALELQNTHAKVLDIAIKYGYDSSTSFARAFSSLHGITPSEARKTGVQLKAYPKMSFQISIKGESAMDYRIETKEAFDIFGIEAVCSLAGAEGFLTPAELWQKCHKDGEYERLAANAGEPPAFTKQSSCKVHAVEYYRKTEENTFPYMLFAFASTDSNADGYKTIRIPAQTYAVFSSETFKKKYKDKNFFDILAIMQKAFYSEWLPTAKYERADGANFEIYGGTNEDLTVELWYPVTAK